jgi:hypothetical protein
VATISVAVVEGQALDLAAICGPAAIAHRAGQVASHDLFALAADDHVDPGRLGQDLAEHEGRMHPTQHPHGLRHHLGGDAQHLFGLVDRRRDRGARRPGRAAVRPDARAASSGLDMMRHRVDEMDVVEPRLAFRCPAR